jgi:hypothetical protein
MTYFAGVSAGGAAACRLLSKKGERSRKKSAVLIGGFFIFFVFSIECENHYRSSWQKDKRVSPAFFKLLDHD